MNQSSSQDPSAPQLRCGIVLGVGENTCDIVSSGQRLSARYAKNFPSPRTERVAPGHLVAVATAPNGAGVVLWRWYDAVVLGSRAGMIRMWEPAHGEVLARPRADHQPVPAGGRAYLSAGLPGADWWVDGPAVVRAEDARVELAEVERLYTEHDLWRTLHS